MILPGNRKLSKEDIVEIVKRRDSGETLKGIADAFKVNSATISKHVKRAHKQKETDKKKKELEEEMKLLDEVNGGIPTPISQIAQVNIPFVNSPRDPPVNAAPIPQAVPNDTIENYGITKDGKIYCNNIEQPFRQNLLWAIKAAGLFSRTQQGPTECPNDTAFFLYRQARDNPKDFLGRFAMIEGRSNDEDENELSKETKKTVAEIEEFLQELDEQEEEENV